jgi:hypothetical protein
VIPLPRLIEHRADRERPRPNHGVRPGQPAIRYIILHATAGSDEGAESWMASAQSRVSAHLHIRRDGTTTRHVPDLRRAWHAGVGSWDGVTDINTESLGWEIGNRNDGRELYTAAQYRTVARLLAHYLPQGIGPVAVLTHAQIAPGRKTDPLGWDMARMWGEYGDLASPRPEPGERRWSPALREWVILTRWVSDAEWYFVPSKRLTDLPSIRAGARWSQMPEKP